MGISFGLGNLMKLRNLKDVEIPKNISIQNCAQIELNDAIQILTSLKDKFYSDDQGWKDDDAKNVFTSLCTNVKDNREKKSKNGQSNDAVVNDALINNFLVISMVNNNLSGGSGPSYGGGSSDGGGGGGSGGY